MADEGVRKCCTKQNHRNSGIDKQYSVKTAVNTSISAVNTPLATNANTNNVNTSLATKPQKLTPQTNGAGVVIFCTSYSLRNVFGVFPS